MDGSSVQLLSSIATQLEQYLLADTGDLRGPTYELAVESGRPLVCQIHTVTIREAVYRHLLQYRNAHCSRLCTETGASTGYAEGMM